MFGSIYSTATLPSSLLLETHNTHDQAHYYQVKLCQCHSRKAEKRIYGLSCFISSLLLSHPQKNRAHAVGASQHGACIFQMLNLSRWHRHVFSRLLRAWWGALPFWWGLSSILNDVFGCVAATWLCFPPRRKQTGCLLSVSTNFSWSYNYESRGKRIKYVIRIRACWYLWFSSLFLFYLLKFLQQRDHTSKMWGGFTVPDNMDKRVIWLLDSLRLLWLNICSCDTHRCKNTCMTSGEGSNEILFLSKSTNATI